MVYVDELQRRASWRYGLSCHLFADTVAELHSFAKSMKLIQAWFQDKKVPHYDLTTSKRVQAVKLGAKETTTKDYLHKIRGGSVYSVYEAFYKDT